MYVQLNARDLILEVSNGALVPVWTEVGAITSSGIDFSANEETADTTDYDAQGQANQEIMQRGRSMAITCRALVDSVTGAGEPGQVVLNSHAELVGPASQKAIRFRYPLDEDWTVWTVTVTRGNTGDNGNNAKVGQPYTLTRCGAATTMAVTP